MKFGTSHLKAGRCCGPQAAYVIVLTQAGSTGASRRRNGSSRPFRLAMLDVKGRGARKSQQNKNNRHECHRSRV